MVVNITRLSGSSKVLKTRALGKWEFVTTHEVFSKYTLNNGVYI